MRTCSMPASTKCSPRRRSRPGRTALGVRLGVQSDAAAPRPPGPRARRRASSAAPIPPAARPGSTAMRPSFAVPPSSTSRQVPDHARRRDRDDVQRLAVAAVGLEVHGHALLLAEHPVAERQRGIALTVSARRDGFRRTVGVVMGYPHITQAGTGRLARRTLAALGRCSTRVAPSPSAQSPLPTHPQAIMAESIAAAAEAAPLPISADIERARTSRASPSCSRASRPRRRSHPAAPAGARSTPRWPSSTPAPSHPSVEWRREFSLLLGLERLLAQDEPHLADGTELTAHQVDALSGTLTALTAEVQRAHSNGERQRRRHRTRRSGGAGLVGHPRRGGDRRGGRARRGAARLGGRGAGPRRGRPAPRAARGPQRRAALLVRARDRRGQDGRRAGLRRGLAHGRHPHPHPPPQPRRPVPRRAARPRLRQAHLAGPARRQGPAPTARSRSRPTSGSCATRARSPTPTRSSSATRPTRRWARRRAPRSAAGTARSSSA